MNRLAHGCLIAATIAFATQAPQAPAPAQAPQPAGEDYDAARAELMKRLGIDGLMKPAAVTLRAQTLLAGSLEGQNDDALYKLARDANIAANTVGFISDEYSTYYRENYRYEFVQKAVAPFHDAYVKLTNELKTYRNQAYFNLGKKALARGDELGAFFLFRDAFRLSDFDEDKGDHKGLRYLAEVEMQKLLGLDGMGAFVYWK